MKDKLTKHHKKPSYFVLRNLLIIALAITFSVAAVAIPVSVSLSTSNPQVQNRQ